MRAIRRGFPAAQIWLLTMASIAPLAERCPHVDVIRTLDLRRSRSAAFWSFGAGRREFIRLLAEFRSVGFDLVMNLYPTETLGGSLRMAIFLYAVRPQRAIGRLGSAWALGFDAVSQAQGHEIDRQLAVAALANIPSAGDLPELWVEPADRRACHALLACYGLHDAGKLACLHAGSAQPEKRWPLENFAEIGQRLAQTGASVVSIGDAGERALSERLAARIPGAVSLAGATSLPILAALLERADLLVSTDSGPMHMGAALGTPMVAIFGPSNPGRFGPRGPGPLRLHRPAAQDQNGSTGAWSCIDPMHVTTDALGLLDTRRVMPRGAEDAPIQAVGP